MVDVIAGSRSSWPLEVGTHCTAFDQQRDQQDQGRSQRNSNREATQNAQ
jgi:hypothetical protein